MVLGYPIAGKLHVTQNAMDTGLCGIIHLFFFEKPCSFSGITWLMQRQDAYITLEPLFGQKSYVFTVLISDHLDSFWEIFKKTSRKNQEFCEKFTNFHFFSKKWGALSTQFLCSLYAVSKLHINCMQFLCGLKQTAYSLDQTAYSLYAVWKPHTNRI